MKLKGFLVGAAIICYVQIYGNKNLLLKRVVSSQYKYRFNTFDRHRSLGLSSLLVFTVQLTSTDVRIFDTVLMIADIAFPM